MSTIKILQSVQLLNTLTGIYVTPIKECPYGTIVFAIGCINALLNLTTVKYDAANNSLEEDENTEQHIIVQILDSLQDYAAVGLINVEFYQLSERRSMLGFAFCILLSLDVLAKLFRDSASEGILNYYKEHNMLAHSASIRQLATDEFNIWLHCVWASTMIISWGIYMEKSGDYRSQLLKLIGYNVLYLFTTIAIYDDDYLERLEWFRMGTGD